MKNLGNLGAIDAPHTHDNPTLCTAIEAAKLGLSVVKVNPSTKRPFDAWKHLQTTAAAPDEIEQITDLKSFAIIGGAISGGTDSNAQQLYLTCIDFDADPDRFLALWRAQTGDLSENLPYQRTGGGGYQLLFKSPLKIGNEKLAWYPNEALETGREIAIETRGEGGYFLVPPSIHPSGNRYEWERGDLSTIPTITQQEAQTLLDAAISLCEAPYERKTLEAAKKKEEKAKVKTYKNNPSVIDAYNAKHEIKETLERFGYKPRGDRYARPDGDAPTVAILEGNKSFHHASNDPLKNGYAQTPFDVFKFYEHGDDLKEAVKSAAQELGIALEKKEQAPAAADVLMKLAHESGTFFRDFCEESYAQIEKDGKSKLYNLKSQAFKSWLTVEYFNKTGKVISARGAVDSVVSTIQGQTLQNPAQETFNRVATFEGNVYYDLGDETGRAIKITPYGWETVNSSPVPFVRLKGSKPQFEPVRGGNIEMLKKLVNVEEKDFVLVVSWLMGFFLPFGAQPHLYVLSEQGTGKTETTNNLRKLLDPNELLSRQEPKNVEGLYIAAKTNAVLAFENLSFVPQWLSDAFCCLATGGGYATRQHYSNDEEQLFKSQRPCIINAITDVVTKPDLLDRVVMLQLPLLTESSRRENSEIQKDFQTFAPQIFGVLLDAVCFGLRNLSDTHLDSLPRMADFTKWMCACAPALGFTQDEFLTAYKVNRRDSLGISAELSSFAISLEDWAPKQTPQKLKGGELCIFKGSSTRLVELLEINSSYNMGSDSKRAPKDWPDNAASAGRQLKRLKTVLRTRGLDITDGKSGSTRWVKVCKIAVDDKPEEIIEDARFEVEQPTPLGNPNKSASLSDFDMS